MHIIPTQEEVVRVLGGIPALLTDLSESNCVFLTSVVSSGGLTRNLLELARRYLPGIATDIVPIVDVSGDPDDNDALFTISGVQRFDVPQQQPCDLCLDGARRPLRKRISSSSGGLHGPELTVRSRSLSV